MVYKLSLFEFLIYTETRKEITSKFKCRGFQILYDLRGNVEGGTCRHRSDPYINNLIINLYQFLQQIPFLLQCDAVVTEFVPLDGVEEGKGNFLGNTCS
uniref:Uncharacterized protein n=1 Tax=Solanum lycopersicum TaxID=4081 RepID=A0A3Q7I1J5_SOLLC